MAPLNKIFFVVVSVLIAVLLAVAYSSWKKESALFSAVETSLSEDEEGRSVFSATIRNDGFRTIVVTGYGYDNPNCVPVENINILVAPGGTFDVEVICAAGLTEVDLAQADFYIQNRHDELGEAQTTFLPNFNAPSSGSGASSGASGGGGGSGPSSTGIGASGPLGGGGGSGGLSGQGFSSPNFISFADLTGPPFITGDNTPTIVALVVGTSCRWSPNDLAFNEMLVGNVCNVDSEGLANCFLSQQPDGTGLDYHVACSDGSASNSLDNNLDIIAVTIDTTPPNIISSSIFPAGGYSFSGGIEAFVLNLNTNEDAECRAAAGTTPTTSFNSMTISLGRGISHSGTIPLGPPGTITILNILCRDNAYNFGNLQSLSYQRQLAPVLVGPEIVIPSPQPSSGDSGGSSVADVADEPSGGAPPPRSDPSKDPTGETVREFNSQRTIFQWFADLFRNIFS
ncbi:MAG: hypothetical protein AABY16_03190 [Nanoarchaeota archaeon]